MLGGPSDEAGGAESAARTKLLTPETSDLWKWLSKSSPHASRKRWIEVGAEVFERKGLLLAAWADLEARNVPNALQLAATDIFVEKAQRLLTFRGRVLYAFGFVTATLTILVLGLAAGYLATKEVTDLLGTVTSAEDASYSYLGVLAFKSTTAGAFVVGIVHFLSSLSRALLHEATVLFNRRHSLRFGRLFVYLKSDKISREDLEAIFNWNAESTTAFRDIKTEKIGKSPAMKLVETPADLARMMSEAVKPAIEAVRQARQER